MTWYFSIVMLEKTRESPLGWKESQPIHPKGNHSWISIRDWCWSWNSNNLATWCKELTQWKRPWCWERLKAGGEGDDRGWDGWIASSTQWTWVGDGQGGLVNCSLWGHKESDTAEQLNWIDFLGFSWWLSVKESSCSAGAAGDTGLIWVQKIPWRKAWQLTPVCLPGPSPWTEESGRLTIHGVAESDTTEVTLHADTPWLSEG